MVGMLMRNLFIHIPKTGGSSINKAPFIEQRTFQHKPISFFHSSLRVDYNLDEIFKFSFVRNPYTRFISGALTHGYATSETINDFIVNEFVENHRKNFRAWEWVHLIPQCMFVYHGGELAVDFIGRFENLEKDWKKICKKLKQEYFKLPHENKGTYNINEVELSPESIEVIKEIYRLDFELFNYSKEIIES